MEQDNKDKTISQLILATQLDGNELLPFAKDNGNGAFLLSLLKAFVREGLASQTQLDGKQNRLIPGYGIKISPDNTISTTLDISPFKVVDVLPTADIEKKIYLIPDSDGSPGANDYIEYLYVDGRWEMLGKFTPAVDLEPYVKSADAERIYAKKSELPDVSGFVGRSDVNTLAEEVAALKKTVQSLKTKLDTIPTIPINDGKCYALQNGEWTVIADVTEFVATLSQDASESTAELPSNEV